METFQSEQLLADNNPADLQSQQQQQQNKNQYHQPAYNKYGTISGFSNKTNNYLLANQNNNQFTNQTYNSNNNNIIVNSANTTNNNNNNGVNPTANSRFRAINRSFRTAVDKSFDMPNNSGTYI